MTQIHPQEIRVALLAGGKSSESTVSLASAKGARAALEEAGFPVTQLDPMKKEDLINLLSNDYDVAFLALHGRYGEDGTIQGLLEYIGLPYTGSGVLSSALAIDKAESKKRYIEAGLKTPKSVFLTKNENYSIENIIAEVGEHSVVKAASEGSTIGIFFVNNARELEEAIVNGFEYDDKLVIETFITGREFTASVLGNEHPEPLPIIEIIPKNGLHDYEAKYTEGGCTHICPAEISDESTKAMQEASVTAHKALMCKGATRSDFIIDEFGQSWILETNTIPGMTAMSLLPEAARVSGLSYPELVTKMIELALEE